MQKPPRRCSRCAQPVLRDGMCRVHYSQRETRRGTPRQRGYGGPQWTRCRAAVLSRDPVCVLCGERSATVADHYPETFRAISARGGDPYDPACCRGLCRPCHSSVTLSQTRKQ